MPNWCANKLIIRHNDQKKIKEVAEAYNKCELLKYFKPCPEELYTEGITRYSADHPEVYDSLRREMKEKYGYESWYEWCVTNWGTKWDISTYEPEVEADGNRLELSFDTAWSPPIEAMETAEEQGFTVELLFYESGVGFCGIYEDGDYLELEADSEDAEEIIDQFI